MASSDDALIIATAAGDSGAFEALVLRHQQRAWNIAARYLGDAQEARDVVQKAFMRVLQNAHRYEAAGTFGAYLRTIVSRLCLDYKAKKKATPKERMSGIAAPPDSISSQVHQNAARSAVRHALDLLPPRQRLAVVLRYYDGAGYKDISKALGVSSKAVERLLDRGRKRLGELLQTAVRSA